MPVGIELTDDSGNTVINPDMKNFGLVATGSVVTNSTLAGANLYFADVSFSGRSSPMLALHGSAWCGLLGVTVSGSQYTWRIVAPFGTTVEYWLFDEYPSPTETYGLEVFNAAGERVYHSGTGGLRVLSFFSDQVVQQTYTANSKIAFIQGRPSRIELLFQDRYFGDPNPDQLATVLHGAQFPEDHKITVFYKNFETQQVNGGGGIVDPKPEILVVDVTNLGPNGIPNPPPDVTPNLVNWTNISTSQSDATSNSQTITGIDTPISLEVTSSNPNHVIKVFVAGAEQPSNVVDVNNNHAVYFVIENYQASTQAGTVTVTNKSDNDTVLNTFTCSVGPVGDITPDPFNFANYSNTNDFEYTTPQVTISGLGAGETIDIQTYTFGGTLVPNIRKNGGLASNPASFQNGDKLSIYTYNSDNQFDASGTVYVRNNTDNNTVLDSFNLLLGPIGLGP